MFAELHCKSHYSFLSGASSPEELVYKAAELEYNAIAITDECSYAGIVKAFSASEQCGIKLIVGSEFFVDSENGKIHLLLLAPDRTAYSEISALISKARRRSPKGQYSLHASDLRFGLQHCLAIWLPQDVNFKLEKQQGRLLKSFFPSRLWIGVSSYWASDDQHRYHQRAQLSKALSVNMVACNDVHMHCKTRKPLQDTLTAIRLNTTVQQLGSTRQINAERYLKPLNVLQHLYPTALLEETNKIADLCHFSMHELRYQYPRELVPDNLSPHDYLRQITLKGADRRWPKGVPSKVLKLINYELKLIHELQYEYYFLTVYDIVKFARSQNILCQGRGSAANSAVCYCLGITEVDPHLHQMLFERFISKERDEPPDIDVDFESDRREEIIQYIYNKYSRKRTALTATVVTYRRKSAVRDVGKALGLPLSFINELNQSMAWWDKIDTLNEHMRHAKLSFDSNLCKQFFKLVKEILGTPRHLSQHVGGFLITEHPTSTLVPIENAAMPNRTIIQWDKYDIEILKLLKVDVLGLGMLSAIHRSLDMINAYQSPTLSMQSIPREDPSVYDMLCEGDSVGVFQVESRAQMSMLPRLQPRNFYDLVIEVAIVRPGPIQGDMVHPYLKRRDGIEPVTYPNDEIKQVLKRTLGIPIFQEQVIKLTMVAAGFSGGQADELRRAMATWGRNGELSQFEDKLIGGMLERGHDLDFAKRLFQQIQGFGNYGFPESHSASFAILVYLSAWIKRHHPAAFYAGILNSQPMGFYTPSQLVQDARRHKVSVLPICVNHSQWEHSLVFENDKNSSSPKNIAPPALRLGLLLVKGVSEESAKALIKSRNDRAFQSIADFKARKVVNDRELTKLADANAFHQFERNRRRAYWHSLSLENLDDTYTSTSSVSNGLSGEKEQASADYIPQTTPFENMLADYRSARGVSLDYHPMQLLRNDPRYQGKYSRCTTADRLLTRRHNSLIEIAGVVTGRQRPGSASGVIFMTLEDETGNINVVLWNKTQERFKREILSCRLLYIKGTLEISNQSKDQHGVANVIAGYIEDQDHLLPTLKSRSRDFH